MPRIGFRRILPIVQLAVLLAVAGWSDMHGKAATAAKSAQRAEYEYERAKRAAAERQGKGAGIENGEAVVIGVDLGTIHQPPPLAVDIVLSLNAPAVIAALLFVVLPATALGVTENDFEWLPGGSDSAWLIPIAAFLVFQWYLIGRWYDRRVGLAPQPMPRPPGRLRRLVTWTGLILAGVLGFLFLGRSFFSYIDDYFQISLAVWFFIAAAAQVQKIRRWRGDPSALTSLRLS